MGKSRTDEARFDALYRRHHRDVLAYFVRRVPRRDAEDATAEVFTVAWRRLDHIPAGERAIAWLFGVAHNVLSNHRRGLRRARRLTTRLKAMGEPPGESPELQVVKSAEDALLLDALDRLRPRDAEILRLVAWEKLSHRVIGDTLGISEAAAGQRISRARKRLAAEVGRLEAGRRSPISLLNKKGGTE
jgi:RNA polymerase sigma-70 factor (ECF subfamily)